MLSEGGILMSSAGRWDSTLIVSFTSRNWFQARLVIMMSSTRLLKGPRQHHVE